MGKNLPNLQYFMINHNGKEYEKECTYIYIYIYREREREREKESLCFTAENKHNIVIQLYFS